VVGTGRAAGPRFPRQPHWFSSLTLHPDGRWLISDELILRGGNRWQRPFRTSTYGSRVLLRRPNNLAVIRELPNISRVLAISPDGKRLLGLDRQGWAALWETQQWSRLIRFAPGSLEQPTGVLSSNGRVIGIVDRNTGVSFWSAVSGRRMAVVPLAQELIGFVQNDAACLLTSGRGWGTTVFSADTQSGKVLRNLGKELGYSAQCVVSRDGTLIASSESDNELLIWHTDSWTQSHRASLPRDRWQKFVWSPDGTSLLVAGLSGSLWHLDPSNGASTRIYTRKRDHGQLTSSRGADLVAVSDGDRIIMLKQQHR
jgi:WD40 repeat protein